MVLQSSDARGVSFGSEYVSVRAEIQEPTVYITTRSTDEKNNNSNNSGNKNSNNDNNGDSKGDNKSVSTAEVNVGTAYLGVPLTRRVKMVNLSNLEVSLLEACGKRKQ